MNTINNCSARNDVVYKGGVLRKSNCVYLFQYFLNFFPFFFSYISPVLGHNINITNQIISSVQKWGEINLLLCNERIWCNKFINRILPDVFGKNNFTKIRNFNQSKASKSSIDQLETACFFVCQLAQYQVK